MAFDAFQLPSSAGLRFCVHHYPDPAVRVLAAVVYIHPFAEEMNKSRRMAAVQARAFAAAGYPVLQIDLHGCGDSQGDFGDTSWSGWIDDVVAACGWMREQTGGADLWLWGLRTGCLIASEAAKRIDYASRFLFWQPVLSGKQYLQQFLRLKIAGDALAGAGKGSMERLKADLAHGRPVEVAGYALSPELARGLEAAELTLPERNMRVEWLELSANPGGQLSPAAASRIEKWTAQGHAVRGTNVCGPTFWQTAEIEECTDLVAATLGAMGQGSQP